MPPIRTSRNKKPPPEGFDEIEDTLLEFANRMKDGIYPPTQLQTFHIHIPITTLLLFFLIF